MESKLKAIITIGVSASGKSTFAKELIKNETNYFNIERDAIREELLVTKFKKPKNSNGDCTDNIWRWWKFKNEDLVNLEVDRQIELAHSRGNNIICSDTNLNPKYREALKLKLENLGYEVEYKIVGLDLSFEELCMRDLWRKNSVGGDIIWKQWKQFNAEFGIKPIVFDTTLPKRFLVDLDGTLAINNSGRSPYDWHRVKDDTPNDIVLAMMCGITESYPENPNPIFMSGRDSICRQDTIDWIYNTTGYNKVWINENLYMRKQDDMRKDTIVKEELIKTHLVDKYNIICALDDRPCVIRHYNLLGIYVINCSNTLEEF